MGNAKGNHCLGSIHHQDQDHCSTRKEILRMDRRIHLGFPLHLPTDVDHQASTTNAAHPLSTENASKLYIFYYFIVFNLLFMLFDKSFILMFIQTFQKNEQVVS